jgi:predicted transcriptional regulator
MTHKRTFGKVKIATYERVLHELRSHGALTPEQLRERLGLERTQIRHAVHRGRLNGLIIPHKNNPRYGGRKTYQAAHVPGWPYPAPDTVVR